MKIIVCCFLLFLHFVVLAQNKERDTSNVDKEYYLQGVVVRARPDVYKKSAIAPLSKVTIPVVQIERSAGGNRDISKIVTVFPGVSTPPPSGNRNDFYVRGGGPMENKFYVDGFEVPSINHFSTQGAGGGPVGLLDANLIRKVDFYSGSFPVARSNALSSIMDVTLKDGSPAKNTYKLTVGASEVALGSDGNIMSTDETGYAAPKLFYATSIRYSYLQFLFKALKLPFLPTFSDAQVKLRYRLNSKNEFSFLFLGGLDRMSLNEDNVEDEKGEYILGYVPKLEQDVFTAGISYKYYYSGANSSYNTLAIFLSNSYLNNRNIKYLNNDESNPDNLNLNYKSVENQLRLRVENKIRYNSNVTFLSGIGLEMPTYTNETYQKRIVLDKPLDLNYYSRMNMLIWNGFASVEWLSKDKKVSLSGGLRLSGADYNSNMANPLNQISPRLAFSYEFAKGWRINAGVGRYYQLPPYTAMGYNDFENRSNLKYMGVNQAAIGLEYLPNSNLQIQLEPFYKYYFNALYSPIDSIPLTQGAIDYGVYGNESAKSGLKGFAYGIELSARYNMSGKLFFIGTYTFSRSKYEFDENIREVSGEKYGNMPWDNIHNFSCSVGYQFGKNYALGVKYRVAGGAPYTPYDMELSSNVLAWNIKGQPYYDYSLYNTERLPMFNQLDIRFDKSFYFKKWALELYLDIQNALNFKYKYPDIIISTGDIENLEAPTEEQKYTLKKIENEDGTILPTIGLIISL